MIDYKVRQMVCVIEPLLVLHKRVDRQFALSALAGGSCVKSHNTPKILVARRMIASIAQSALGHLHEVVEIFLLSLS